MDLTKGYALDEVGELVPPGLSRHVYDWSSLMGEGRPAWLQEPKADGTSGSVGASYNSVAHGVTNPGYFLVNTGSTQDALARLATVALPMNQYAAVMFQCFGVQFSSANGAEANLDATISFGIHSVAPTNPGNAGGRVLQRNTDTFARFSMPGVAGDHAPFGASFRTLREQYRYRNMGFLLYRTGQMVFFEDDPANPVGTLDAAGVMQSGPVCGALMMQTKTPANQTLRLAGARLTLWREPETL